MSLSSLAGASTQAMGEYSGPPFLRELSRNLITMVMDNIWIVTGAVIGTILLWIYIRR
jgi:hypothetical protein